MVLDHVEKDINEVTEVYSGKYQLGKKHGYGTIKYKSGDIYKGEFKFAKDTWPASSMNK